jgi:uncharacterized protein (TIGR02466 family)
MQHLRLFPTNIGIFEVDDFQTLNQELLAIPEITDGDHKFHSKNDVWDLVDTHPAIKRLHTAFLEFTAQYAGNCYDHEYKAEHFKHAEGWAENIEPGEYNFFMHSHRATDVVGVYYYSVAENSGCLDFVDPRANLGNLCLNYTTTHNIYRHTPKEGQLVLYPGWLLHYIHPNKSNKTRRIISSNLKIREECRFIQTGSTVTPDTSFLKIDK